MGSNSQEPAETARNTGGRPKVNALRIDWHERAEAVWEKHPHLKMTVGALHQAAGKRLPNRITGIDDFRDKFNGKRDADAAYAEAIFAVTGFEAIGVDLLDWLGASDAWERSLVRTLRLDGIARLNALAQDSQLAVAVDSTRDEKPMRLRRLQPETLPDQRVRIGEFMRLTLTYTGDQVITPAHLLAFEWSGSLQDWQIFNALPSAKLDARQPRSFSPGPRGAIMQIPLGLPIGPPPDVFDLYVLARRAEFDHRALAMIDAITGKAILPPERMQTLLGYLLAGADDIVVGKATFAAELT